jgi:rubrerythrin
MALALLHEKGCPLDQQRFTWRDMVPRPISKLDDDAYTRVMIILMNGLETEALRFQHACAQMNRELRLPLAEIRRVERHQATLVNWLIGADHSPLETTIAYEQAAIEVTAALAQTEPDAYVAQVLRFGLLEDFDHLYRYSALLDRMEGKDANNITQSYTDIAPGRPTNEEHRAPADDLRDHYDKTKAQPLTKLHAATILGAELQVVDFYQNIGNMFSNPSARMLYAEIGSIEEQHVTQYESLLDPTETWLEKWLLHEAMEAYNYYSCVQQETNTRIRAIWERFLDYELGHLSIVADLFKEHERRDPAELLPEALPEPIPYRSRENREFVRQTLNKEVDLRATGPRFVDKSQEPERSIAYREQLNADGSPSQLVAAGYQWTPGTELTRDPGLATV